MVELTVTGPVGTPPPRPRTSQQSGGKHEREWYAVRQHMHRTVAPLFGLESSKLGDAAS